MQLQIFSRIFSMLYSLRIQITIFKHYFLAAGIPQSKLVEAHGSFATATCRKCKTSYKGNDIKVNGFLNFVSKLDI